MLGVLHVVRGIAVIGGVTEGVAVIEGVTEGVNCRGVPVALSFVLAFFSYRLQIQCNCRNRDLLLLPDVALACCRTAWVVAIGYVSCMHY